MTTDRWFRGGEVQKGSITRAAGPTATNGVPPNPENTVPVALTPWGKGRHVPPLLQMAGQGGGAP